MGMKQRKMSDSASIISDSEELLYIYVTLKKLKCLQTTGAEEMTASLDSSLFPKRFLLKQLNERLASLDELAAQICNDLFGQVCGPPAKSPGASGSNDRQPIDVGNGTIRYPEFDEYFHFCLHQLHDFMIGLRWHEIDIEQLSKSDSDYVTKNLELVRYLLDFQHALVDLVREASVRSPGPSIYSASNSVSNAKSQTSPEGKKSALKSSPSRRSSPEARRRVRFKDLPLYEKPVTTGRYVSRAVQSDLADNHSVLALDLLIYAVNVYIQRLADTLIVWSNSVQNDLGGLIDAIFDAKTRVRANQLRVIARKIKIYNDVHLTVLDHLSEIKRTYLIKHVHGTLLSRDSAKLLHGYKDPRLRVYLQRIGLDVEAKVLARLIKECLQIFFNLIVCEINANLFETTKARASSANREAGRNKSQENILNFVANWLKVDDVLFGRDVARKPADPPASRLAPSPTNVDTLLDGIQRPQLVAKSSTLSSNGAYKSSSRILVQMDNLAEFMREFIHTIVERLRYRQQVRYFLEAISGGLMRFFDIVGPKLEQQLLDIRERERKASPKSPTFKLLQVDVLTVRMRCLKFIHVIGLADRTVTSEAAREKVDLAGDIDMDLKLARLAQLCANSKHK